MRRNSPTVAAIIPTRNRAEPLSKALTSVFEQTYDSIEAIIVDGGSTDKTPHVVAEHRDRYGNDRVSYIRNEEPKGLPAARNQAAERTGAEFLAFLDDDDRWHPEKIERQIEQFTEREGSIGLSYTGRVSKDESGKRIHTARPSLDGRMYRRLLHFNVIGSPSRVMVPVDVFDTVDGFDEEFRYQEDWDFYLRIARNYEIGCISDPLVTRLAHSGGMSNNVREQRHYSRKVLHRYSTELRTHGLCDAAWSVHHRETGIDFSQAGNTHAGRKEFRQALQYQWCLDGLILYAFTLLGPRGFRLGTSLKRGLEGYLGAFR